MHSGRFIAYAVKLKAGNQRTSILSDIINEFSTKESDKIVCISTIQLFELSGGFVAYAAKLKAQRQRTYLQTDSYSGNWFTIKGCSGTFIYFSKIQLFELSGGFVA